METVVFMRALGVMIIVVLIVSGLFYWLSVLFRKIAPNFKYHIKYKVLKKKFDEVAVDGLKEQIEKGITEKDLYKDILLSGGSIPQAKELVYIFNQLKNQKEVQKK